MKNKNKSKKVFSEKREKLLMAIVGGLFIVGLIAFIIVIHYDGYNYYRSIFDKLKIYNNTKSEEETYKPLTDDEIAQMIKEIRKKVNNNFN